MAECKTCKWWTQDPKLGQFYKSPVGWCDRFPPAVTQDKPNRWPTVSANMHCGEHPDYVRQREDDFLRRYIQMLEDKRHIDKTYEVIERDD